MTRTKDARGISPVHHKGSSLSELDDGGVVERVFEGVRTEGRPLLAMALGGSTQNRKDCNTLFKAGSRKLC